MSEPIFLNGVNEIDVISGETVQMHCSVQNPQNKMAIR